MKAPVICHLCDFSAEYPGTFIESVLFLARYCKIKLQIGTVCFFPEAAAHRDWLQLLEKEGVHYGFLHKRRGDFGTIRVFLEGRFNPVIFHTHFFLYDLCPLFLKLVSYRGSKIVWHYHNPTGMTFHQRIKDIVKLRVIGRYLGVRCIAVGDSVYHSLLQTGICNPAAVLVHNGVNTQRFVPNDALRKAARESLCITREQMVFLLLGWDPYRKGADIFVRASVEARRRKHSNSVFVVVAGETTRNFLSDIRDSSRLGSSIRIINPWEDFAALLNGADVLVSPSRSEGFPYAVAEALAAGKLVISSDILRSIYRDAKGVWFFRSENWEELGELMRCAEDLSDIERRQLGETNRNFVVRHYSLQRWAENITSIYRELWEAEGSDYTIVRHP